MTSARQLTTQRYSANACTLEVTASPSVLSRWSQQPLLKQARFQLWLQRDNELQLLAAGDQAQLILLVEQVNTYLHQHLGQSTVGLRLSGTSLASLTQHSLMLLDAEQTLSTLELFDLAETLDQYEQASVLLPPLVPARVGATRPTTHRRRQRLMWTGSVAAAFVVALSVTAILRQQPELASLETAVENNSGATEFDVAAEDAPPPALDGAAAEPLADPELAAVSSEAADAAVTQAATPSATVNPSVPEASRSGAVASEAAPVQSPTPVAPPDEAVEGTADANAAASETESSVLRSQPSPAVASAPPPEPQAEDDTSTTEQAFSLPPDPGLEAARTAGGSASRDSSPDAISPAADAVEEDMAGLARPLSVPAETVNSVGEYFATQLANVAVSSPLLYQVSLDEDGRLRAITPLNAAAEQYAIPTPELPIAPAQAMILQVTVNADGTVTVGRGE